MDSDVLMNEYITIDKCANIFCDEHDADRNIMEVDELIG